MPLATSLRQLFKAGSGTSARTSANAAILVSRTTVAAANDQLVLANPPAERLVLQGQVPGEFTNLLQAVGTAVFQECDSVIVGASIAEDLHPALASAIGELCARSCGEDCRIFFQIRGELEPFLSSGDETAYLCEWILAQLAPSPADGLSSRELQYFLANSGYKAEALERILAQFQPRPPLPTMVEIGGGIGLISWLLTTDDERATRQVFLAEPTVRYQHPMAQLWSRFAARGDDRCAFLAKVPSWKFDFRSPADFVLLGQTLHNVPVAEREPFIDRCRLALNSGGFLIVNESVAADGSGQSTLLRRDDLVQLLSRFGHVSLYRGIWRWEKAEDPLEVAAADYFSDSFLVLRPGSSPVS